MNDKQVNIYAYNDNRGVFFYNGNNSSRDEVFDALKEDSKTSLAPKISGYKITEISGLGEDEAEIFTAEQGVGNGVFVTGQRVPEKYIDIVAVGSGPEAPEAYYNYAKDFHKIGEWYKLNVQYKGRWVKVKTSFHLRCSRLTKYQSLQHRKIWNLRSSMYRTTGVQDIQN